MAEIISCDNCPNKKYCKVPCVAIEKILSSDINNEYKSQEVQFFDNYIDRIPSSPRIDLENQKEENIERNIATDGKRHKIKMIFEIAGHILENYQFTLLSGYFIDYKTFLQLATDTNTSKQNISQIIWRSISILSGFFNRL